MIAPLPPVAAGTVNSVMAAPAVKVLAETEPVPKDGAESVPRMVTVADEGVPIAKFWPVVSLKMRSNSKVIVSSLSVAPSAAARNGKVRVVEGKVMEVLRDAPTAVKAVFAVVLMSLTL